MHRRKNTTGKAIELPSQVVARPFFLFPLFRDVNLWSSLETWWKRNSPRHMQILSIWRSRAAPRSVQQKPQADRWAFAALLQTRSESGARERHTTETQTPKWNIDEIKREYENRKESKAHTAVRRANSCRKQFIYKLKQFHVSFDLVFSQCAIYEQFAAIYMKKKLIPYTNSLFLLLQWERKKGKMKMYKTHKNWEASQRTCKQAWWRETTAKREMQKKTILKHHRETDLNSALPSAHYREGKVRARKRDI